jgi:hypothetical protein
MDSMKWTLFFQCFPVVGFITVLIHFSKWIDFIKPVNPLNAELNPICHLLALLGGATIVDVSRLRVNAFYVGFYLSMFSIPNVDLKC